MRTEIQDTKLYKEFIKALDIHDMVADDNPFVVKCCKIAEAYAAQQKPSSSATAEEIIESILESLGDPINIHNHAFEIRPYTVDHKTEWWIFHKEVASGEPLAQWLSKFATLHAQKIADKMVSERYPEKFIRWITASEVILFNGRWNVLNMESMTTQELYRYWVGLQNEKQRIDEIIY